MSERLRIQSANVLFHVISRGNAKQIVFHDADDHLRYLELVCRYKVKYRMRVYHYVPMNNHAHFLIEPTRDGTLSKFMMCLTLAYTKYYNKKYGCVGHVWQGRFRAIPIETDAYYLRCAIYIELNPVRARVVEHPSDYPWSSYRVSSAHSSHEWLDAHPLLEPLQIATDGQNRYESLVIDEIQRTIMQRSETFSFHPVYGKQEFLDWYEVRSRPGEDGASLQPRDVTGY